MRGGTQATFLYISSIKSPIAFLGDFSFYQLKLSVDEDKFADSFEIRQILLQVLDILLYNRDDYGILYQLAH